MKFRAKISLLIFGAVIGTSFPISIFSYIREKRNLYNILYSQSLLTSFALSSPLQFESKDGVLDVIESQVSQIENFSFAIVFDRDGKEFVRYPDGAPSIELPDKPENLHSGKIISYKGGLLVFSPVYSSDGSELLGVSAISISNKALRNFLLEILLFF